MAEEYTFPESYGTVELAERHGGMPKSPTVQSDYSRRKYERKLAEWDRNRKIAIEEEERQLRLQREQREINAFNEEFRIKNLAETRRQQEYEFGLKRQAQVEEASNNIMKEINGYIDENGKQVPGLSPDDPDFSKKFIDITARNWRGAGDPETQSVLNALSDQHKLWQDAEKARKSEAEKATAAARANASIFAEANRLGVKLEVGPDGEPTPDSLIRLYEIKAQVNEASKATSEYRNVEQKLASKKAQLEALGNTGPKLERDKLASEIAGLEGELVHLQGLRNLFGTNQPKSSESENED